MLPTQTKEALHEPHTNYGFNSVYVCLVKTESSYEEEKKSVEYRET